MPYIIDFVTAETINVNQELKVNGIPITPSGGGSFTGGTVTGQTQFTNGLTATTISATTYQNLPGGGIEGSNYIYVAANGTDTENATELQTAYTTAVGLSPSATNRITLVCGPGYYNFGETIFTMDTQYIDLVSLDGNRSIIFNPPDGGRGPVYAIYITANDVFVKGVDVGTNAFVIATNLNLLKVENCAGGDNSFGGNPNLGWSIVSGTFTNCQGGVGSFGGNEYGGDDAQVASGTFTDCTAGNFSFGGVRFGISGTASGVFTNCTGGELSFGGTLFGSGTASGTFTNCMGGGGSFGGFDINGGYPGVTPSASGVFTDCTGGDGSFGGRGTASGVFTNCTAVGGDYSFGGLASGTFTYCTGGFFSFGAALTLGSPSASGVFTDCTGGDYSFGGLASGTFTNCKGGEQSFGGNANTASGTFTYCTGGANSFGNDPIFGGTLTGKLYYCRLTSGNFQTVSDGGITRLCLDGSNVENNQG